MTDPTYRRIAVLDIGKTNAKVVVIEAATGAEIASRRMPNRVLPGPPYPHYDVDGLWIFILEALAAFAKHPGYDAVSITTHGASAVLLDANGDLAMPALDYEHDYPAEIAAAYDAARPPFSETCSPRLALGLNLGAQLHFLKTRFPDRFSAVRTIMTYPQYWAFRLTGVAANEATSLGCHTDLWVSGEGRYSSLVDTLGIRELMAPLRSAFDRLGDVRPEIASQLGLARPLPVYCGIHDSNASLLPHLVRRTAPFAVVSTGTWVISFAVGGELTSLDPTRDTLANTSAYGQPVPSARFMGGREFEILTADLGRPDPVLAEAAVEAVIARQVMVLPNVVEGSGPFPGRTMAWIGNPVDEAERYVAASLYIALMSAACLDLLKADGPVVVEGPFAQNAVYLKALSSVTGRPVKVLKEGASTGTADGAALLTGIAAPVTEEITIAGGYEIAAYARAWREALQSGS
ncbi:FGGY-family carbohydrate kinase [Rhizobium sp. RU36D]|uniref:FGGY-family carbohydrate kinase n=1 Tax=Rhizobium sp. RU36D TaxID=1907415 RepID=UPI0009D8AE76|nr:FGGY-family carbohydrate kinase [Rhizobium sp. RU36D]SMC65646.1 Sugar (pentulose or hexulose) kinase [Rhizobium sp. RU36D]